MSSANIILVGFMGTGKTTVGKLIAERLGWRFADTDQIIEEREGRTIRDIFETDGEPAFRQIESRVCQELTTWKHAVISTGGGIVLDPANRDNLNNAGLVVCLDAPPDEIIARLAGAEDRPLLKSDNPHQRIAELLEARASAYNAIEHHVDTEGYYPEEVAGKVLEIWQKRAGLIDRLMFLLRIWTPYQLIHGPNPVFDFDRRKSRLPSADNLKKFTLLGFYGFNAVIVLILILATFANIAPARNTRPSPLSTFGLRGFGQIPLVFQTFSFSILVVADLYYLAITVSSINQQIETGHWDLLRLSMLKEDEIISAKVAVAQIRGWKIMTVERALLVGSALFSLYAFLTGMARPANFGTFNNFSVVGTSFISVGISLISGAFSPLWRMQAFTSAGIAVSARVRGSAFAALATGAVILISHLLLNAVTSFGGFNLLFFRFGGRYGGFLFPTIYPAAAVAVGLVITYFFYRALRNASMRLLQQYAFQSE